MGMLSKLIAKFDDDEPSSGEEITDDDAVGLSYVGTAAYDVLRKHHNEYHRTMWNVTSGITVGELHQTPTNAFPGPAAGESHPEGHSDWFPEKMKEIVEKTEVWCDVLSLGPPDGVFMIALKAAMATLAKKAADGREDPITVRMMFGNIIGMPVNCARVIEELTAGLPEDVNIRLWVGAWRRGVSWNHAKIIAVDGRYLHTGGHNMWDPHYLKINPIHDLSMELEGPVAHDGHRYANAQWAFVEKRQETFWGTLNENVPDWMPTVIPTRVTISEYPVGVASEHAPLYRKRIAPSVPEEEQVQNPVPIITMGRYGSIIDKARPSDDAFVAMIDSAQTIVRLALQDLGPICFPGTKTPLPGTGWPKAYLSALGRAIWERGVDVEIILSSPGSTPGGLSPMESSYGNGWSCADVASEIIKTVKKQFPDAEDDALRAKVTDNLRVCFMKEGRGREWEDGQTMGFHSKHFIVDDVAYYLGSQNLYVCDLAEWGVLVDNADATTKALEEYWNPMWECSHTGEDLDVQEVMDGLDIDRDGQDPSEIDDETKLLMAQAEKANNGFSHGSKMYGDEEAGEQKEDDTEVKATEGNAADEPMEKEGFLTQLGDKMCDICSRTRYYEI